MWTAPKRRELMSRWNRGEPPAVIAEAMGISLMAVHAIRKGELSRIQQREAARLRKVWARKGAEKRKHGAPTWPTGELFRIKEMCAAGMSYREIAAAMDRAEGSVAHQIYRMRNHGWDIPNPATQHMRKVPLANLENRIIKPGFEKHLEPLLYYKGNITLGRVHRLWNFGVGMMLQGCQSLADGTERLGKMQEFSHLCGPSTAPQHSSLSSFFSRVLQTPQVHGEDPEFIEYIRSLKFWRFTLESLPRVTHIPDARWVGDWRVYEPYPYEKYARHPKGERTVARPPKALTHRLIHEGGDAQHRLLAMVDRAVPRRLPPDLRADICQDLIVGILCGDFAEDDLRLPVKEMTRRVQKMFPSKYGPISLDALVAGTDDLRVIDTLADDHESAFL